MRTKTLLAAAILAAGIASSVAQSNVYSLNVVGYVSKNYDSGFHLIANPLNATNNTVAAVLPNLPDFSYVYKYVNGAYENANGYSFGTWDNPNQTLNPGEGAFLLLSDNYTNVYVGEVLQGSLTNTLIPGFNMVGTKVPQQGGVQAVHNLQPGDFDYVYQYKNHAYLPPNGHSFGSWDAGDPVIGVGEGFWFQNAQATANPWTRNFTVGP